MMTFRRCGAGKPVLQLVAANLKEVQSPLDLQRLFSLSMRESRSSPVRWCHRCVFFGVGYALGCRGVSSCWASRGFLVFHCSTRPMFPSSTASSWPGRDTSAVPLAVPRGSLSDRLSCLRTQLPRGLCAPRIRIVGIATSVSVVERSPDRRACIPAPSGGRHRECGSANSHADSPGLVPSYGT